MWGETEKAILKMVQAFKSHNPNWSATTAIISDKDFTERAVFHQTHLSSPTPTLAPIEESGCARLYYTIRQISYYNVTSCIKNHRTCTVIYNVNEGLIKKKGRKFTTV